MGCSITVYFANTFMYYRTKRLLDDPPPGLLYLGRYIDDLINDKLRLTYVIGGNWLEALDLLIKINKKRKLTISLFRKPTDGHQICQLEFSTPRAPERACPTPSCCASSEIVPAWPILKKRRPAY